MYQTIVCTDLLGVWRIHLWKMSQDWRHRLFDWDFGSCWVELSLPLLHHYYLLDWLAPRTAQGFQSGVCLLWLYSWNLLALRS